MKLFNGLIDFMALLSFCVILMMDTALIIESVRKRRIPRGFIEWTLLICGVTGIIKYFR